MMDREDSGATKTTIVIKRWHFMILAIGIFLIFHFLIDDTAGYIESSAEKMGSKKGVQEEGYTGSIYSKSSAVSYSLTSDNSAGLFKVSWSVALGKDEYAIPFLTDVLQSKMGWSWAGVDFEYSPQEQGEFHIVFQTYSNSDEINPCYYSVLAGCSNVKVTPSKRGLQCTLSVRDEYFIQSSPNSALSVLRLALTNHEIGHCFGLTHSENVNDVMFRFGDMASPTPSLQEIEILADLIEFGDIYTAIENLHGARLSEK